MILSQLYDWEKFADKFIPQGTESLNYVSKHPELMMDENKVLEHERDLNIIRNHICSSSLRRPFSECSREEIAQDKYKSLMCLTEKRPELMKIIISKLLK